MPRRDKRLEKARRNPRVVDWKALLQILVDAGCQIKPASKHLYIAKYPGILERIIIPQQNPLREVYVKQAFAFIEDIQVRNLERGEEE